MPRYLAYTSLAHPDMTAQRIDALLLDARAFNARIGVTGVLLYDGRRFFQYFEGTDYATEQVMARIQAAQGHHDLHLLADSHRNGQEFDRWYMGFCQSPPTFIQRLENSSWQQTLYTLRLQTNHSPALEALNHFLQEQAPAADIGLARMHH